MRIGFTSLGMLPLSAFDRTQKALARSLGRLSSGQRITSPRDDIAGFAMATKLDAQARGLRESVRQAEQTRTVINDAATGVSSLTDILYRMREIAVSASSETLSTSERSNLQSELVSLVSQYQHIVSSTTSSGRGLLNGEASSLGLDLSNVSADQTIRRTIGTGAYQAAITFSPLSLTTQRGAIAEDFNNDGYLDFLSASDSRFSVMLGNGQGVLSPGITSTGGGTNLLAVDINQDGILDVISGVSASLNGEVTVSHGNGDGKFTVASTITMFSGSMSGVNDIDFGDLDGDGDYDIIANIGADYFAYALNQGSGVFSSPTTVDDYGLASITDVTIVDINQDGYGDVVTRNNSSDLAYNLSNASGSVDPIAGYLAFWLSPDITRGDVNNDGIVDLLGSWDLSTTLNMGLISSTGQFASTSLSTSGTGISDVKVLDINNDGLNDILLHAAAADNFITHHLGRGAASFKSAVTYGVDANAQYVFGGDFNGDGVAEIGSVRGPLGVTIFRPVTTTESALGRINIESAESASELVRILDATLTALDSAQAKITALHSRLDFTSAHQSLLADEIEEAKNNLTQTDLALETAEAVRLQILQQAQVAVQSHSLSSMSIMLKLLDSLESK